MTRILVLLGSPRADSCRACRRVAPAEVKLTLFDWLGELPFYNDDIDTEDVAESGRHCGGTERADVSFTPEYNASIPGVLKNAIDWLSRPYGKGALKGKPLAVIGASLGSFGGVWRTPKLGSRRDCRPRCRVIKFGSAEDTERVHRGTAPR